MRYSNLALMTDFGDADGYVAAMKGVILGITGDVHLLDIGHNLHAQDVQAAADLLCDVVPYLPRGAVIVAVVDPGVGTERRALAIESSERQHIFVGPDNGLLWLAAGERAVRIHAIDNSSFMLPQPASTFHGRDVFAPAAAHLALGVPIERMGPAVSDMRRLSIDAPCVSRHSVVGQIMRFDRFGNAISNISATTLPAPERWASLRVRLGEVEILGVQQTYARVEPGELLATIGGFGKLEIAVRNGSASQRLGLHAHASYAVEVRW